MPYIPQTDRDLIDPFIMACPKGWAACYHLVKNWRHCTRYHHWAQAIAVFECAYLEAIRRTGQRVVCVETPITLPCGLPESISKLAEFVAVNFLYPDGALNYCCTLLAERPSDLLVAKEFMYANDIGPYEDKAIEKNGDLPIYATYPTTER